MYLDHSYTKSKNKEDIQIIRIICPDPETKKYSYPTIGLCVKFPIGAGIKKLKKENNKWILVFLKENIKPNTILSERKKR